MFSSLKKIMILTGEQRPLIKRGIVYGILYTAFAGFPIMLLLLFIYYVVTIKLTWLIVCWLSLALIIDFLLQYYFHLKETSTVSAAGYDMGALERNKIINFLWDIPMGVFLGRNLAMIQAVVTNELMQIELYAMQMISKIVGSVASMVFTLILLVCIHPLIALCFAVGVPIALLLNIVIQRMQYSSTNRKLMAQQELIDKTLEFTQGIETLRAYNVQEGNTKRLETIFHRFAQNTIYSEANVIPWMQAFSFVLYIGIPLALYVGCNFMINGKMELYEFLSIAIISTWVFQPMEILSAYSGVITGMELNLGRLEELKTLKVLNDTGTKERIDGFTVEFKDVDFSYVEGFGVSNISFKMMPKTLTAIVGPSGSGKSTLAKLMMRYWDADSGLILMGGQPLGDYKTETLMDNYSVVFQENYLFRDTIANNISLGKKAATLKEIQEAAKAARCHDFIMELPKGYETLVEEGGKSLSMGERQRISIARAILKDAPIVILDEATSGIDPINECEILIALHELTVGKTVMVITHKLNIAENAEQIIVMEDGKVVDVGKHNELLERGGLYANMWSEQELTAKWKIASGGSHEEL